MKTYHANMGDLISHKIMWEPESEPNLNEAQILTQKPEWGDTLACGVPTQRASRSKSPNTPGNLRN